MRVPDEVRKCVVYFARKVQGPDNSIVTAYVGTGFFVTYPAEVQGMSFSYLVTAKHVVKALEGHPYVVRANSKTGGVIEISGSNAAWISDDQDPLLDVAVIPWLSPPEVDFMGIPMGIFATEEVVRMHDIGVGSEIFFTGLFEAHPGADKNRPIVRMGNLAMFPQEIVKTKDWGNMEAYLVDIRSIGGLSGCPVFVRVPQREINGTWTPGAYHFFFLGLMHGHWDIAVGSMLDYSTDAMGKHSLLNMGVAIVVPSYKVAKVINRRDIAEGREQTNKRIREQNLPTTDEKETHP
jgi:hypothetical protein